MLFILNALANAVSIQGNFCPDRVEIQNNQIVFLSTEALRLSNDSGSCTLEFTRSQDLKTIPVTKINFLAQIQNGEIRIEVISSIKKGSRVLTSQTDVLELIHPRSEIFEFKTNDLGKSTLEDGVTYEIQIRFTSLRDSKLQLQKIEIQ